MNCRGTGLRNAVVLFVGLAILRQKKNGGILNFAARGGPSPKTACRVPQ
jgi:hypothetical protein